MKGLQTKQAWIERMTTLGACKTAMAWVRSLPDDITGEEIWNSIPAKHYDWLYWFAKRNQSSEVYELFVKAEVIGEVDIRDAVRDAALDACYAAHAACYTAYDAARAARAAKNAAIAALGGVASFDDVVTAAFVASYAAYDAARAAATPDVAARVALSDAARDAAIRDARYDAHDAAYCAKFRELFPLSKMEWSSEKTDA